ncbi:MAG: hypothetical protein GQ475_07455 [Methylococcaceae bacterium]|nr:hypothetical protein [Methylococcaceae bacterium]
MTGWQALIASLLLISTHLYADSSETNTPQQNLLTAITLLEQHQYQRAADVLERILMIDANTSGAIELYTQALSGITEQQTQNDAKQKEAANTWQLKHEAGFKIGYGTNLNKAPISDIFFITTVASQFEVKLDSQQTMKSGNGVELDIMLYGSKKLSKKKKVAFSTKFLQRTTNQSNFTDYRTAQIAGQYMYQQDNQAVIDTTIAATVLDYMGDARYYAIQMASRYAIQMRPTCLTYGGVDVQGQRQQNSDALNGIYLGGTLGKTCSNAQRKIILELSHGLFRPSNDDLGGRQKRNKIKLAYKHNLNYMTQGDSITGKLNYFRQHDQHGYSPLLANNATRKLDRYELGISYQWPLNSHWAANIEVNQIEQHSNLRLFDLKSTEAWLSIRVKG